MIHLAISVPDILHLTQTVARGGGGGSGGGGSGGGGGGGVAGIGYVASYYPTNWAVNRDHRTFGIIAGAVCGISITALGVALSGGIGFLIFIGACIGLYGGLKGWHAGLRAALKRNKKSVQLAAQQDATWDEATLDARFKEVFTSFQNDWSTFNLKNMQAYTTPSYYAHLYLMLKALQQMQRQNVVGNPTLYETFVYDIHDATDNTQDEVTAYVRATANDQLIDRQTGKTIYTDNSQFQEFWKFNRTGDTWLLGGIRQATEDPFMRDISLEAFATKNGMFYSPDWGWLLLPQRGQLFGQANFKKSDINNHVIGEWHGLLVQMYTYVPFKSSSSPANYLIGQINLPKSYGGIVIKRRTFWNWSSSKPKGYNTMSFEWPDFNKRYRVYATDVDQVTSFELLNPAFMAELHDMGLPINIEVVDNVVYFYCAAKEPNRKYEDMLKVLMRAWRELKM